MTYTIVGCGQSAQNWKDNGYSIGVNDSWKFGKPTNALLVCNTPTRFTHERLNTIINSKPEKFYTRNREWSQFHDITMIKYAPWYGVIRPKQIYYSNSSPFIAISLAYTLGAKEIILWGVDFKNHHMFTEGSQETKKEVERYLELFGCLQELGVSVWLGEKGTAFDLHLPFYQ